MAALPAKLSTGGTMRSSEAHNTQAWHIRHKMTLFVLIFLLAAAGRIINIDRESLWVDEGFSYWAIRHDDMLGVILRDVHPPVYFYLLRGWVSLAGISELALRFFSVLPSLLSVGVIYHAARELDRARGLKQETVVPLLVALMLALADMEIYIAQETRMYALHVLWVLLSMWAFLRWIRTNHRPPFAIWLFFTLALIFTHYVGVAVMAVQGLYILLFLRGRQPVTAVGGIGAIGIIFVVWFFAVIYGQTENVGTGFNVPSTLESLWAWRIHWLTQQWALLGGLAVLGVVAVTSGEAVLRPYRWRSMKIAPAFLLLAWIILPVAGAYILNLRTPILMHYRLTQITPAVVLLIAFGLGSLRQPALSFLLAVIVIYGVAIDDTGIKRPPWREVGMNAARYAQPGDLALADIEPSGDWQVMYYYERFMSGGVERRSLRQWRIEERDSYPTGLPALVSVHNTVWFMHWSGNMDGFRALDETGHVRTAVMTEDWLGNDLNVYRYDMIPEGQIAAYENGMILRDAEFIEESLRLDLWWSSDENLSREYTVSAILLDEDGVLVAQHDGYPFVGERPTTTFEPGEVVYDPHGLQLREDLDQLAPGTYSIGVKVYLWHPDSITVQFTEDGEEFAVLGRFTK